MEEILHQLIGNVSHYLPGFIHPRWCRISSINSTTHPKLEVSGTFYTSISASPKAVLLDLVTAVGIAQLPWVFDGKKAAFPGAAKISGRGVHGKKLQTKIRENSSVV